MQMIQKILCKELYSQLIVAGRKIFQYMYVFQDFNFENDIVIKVGNTAYLGAHCKNLKL